MTPTTLTRPTTCKPGLPHSPTELATQPLKFTPQGHCKNKAVLEAVTESLADKSRPDQCIAAIFKNAFLYRYQAQLNQLIQNIETRHGTGTVLINDNVRRILADDQIDLFQMNDGTVQLGIITAAAPNPQRRELIGLALGETLPTNLCQLIANYDDELEISEKNKNEIVVILKYGTRAEQRSLIAAASRQHQIPGFNIIFSELAKRELFSINLTHADLSNLDLTGIDLSNANLSFANLQNSCLSNAKLFYVKLTGANLNNANLSGADLSYSTLDDARLIATDLSGATLFKVTGLHTCLLFANLLVINTNVVFIFRGSTFKFANFNLSKDNAHLAQYFPQTDAPINVLIGSNLSAPVAPSLGIGKSGTIVIDEEERQLLLTKGITCHANPDGTVQLRRVRTFVHDPLRGQTIDSALKATLPTELNKLISTYDDELEISEINESKLLAILKSNDQTAKASIIAAASLQGRISYLNQLFKILNDRGRELDLSGVDLSNLNLEAINLQYANLSHAVMHGCNLSFSAMRGVNLTGANLNGAPLNNCDLAYADFTGASLIMANLVGSTLSHATLERARLKFANLGSAEMHQADFTNAWLDHADLSRTDLRQAVMENTSLNHANLHRASMVGVNLSHAKMMHARLTGVDLTLANLTCANLSEAILDEVNLRIGAILTDTIWDGVKARRIHCDRQTKIKLPIRLWGKCV